jgi:hypothetical protein
MVENSYLRRIRKEGNGRSGVKAEKKTAKRMGAKLTRYSGAMPNERADMTLEKFLIENKSTTGISLGVKLDWLYKVNQEALQAAKIPALAIQFVDGDGKPVKNGAWVAIREEDFRRLCLGSGSTE